MAIIAIIDGIMIINRKNNGNYNKIYDSCNNDIVQEPDALCRHLTYFWYSCTLQLLLAL